MAQSVSLKIRFHHGDTVAIGPGKADLLDAILEHGSITAAGRAMGMSYKRAWDLVNTMNTSFNKTVVETSKGGPSGGGASLTPFGLVILKQYRKIELKAQAAIDEDLATIFKLLND